MAKKTQNGYLNNPRLKQVGEVIEFTQEHIDEYEKCSVDPIYFLETYGKIVALGKGAVPFKLFPYQKRIIHAIMTNRKIIGKLGRQMGKQTIIAGYFAWFVLFGGKETKSAILANKLAVAKEIFSRVQFIIENVPKWLQQGVEEWNKTQLTLENGQIVMCSATSPSAVRGFSFDNIFCDEFAHLGQALAEEFIASVFPTLSSSDTTKLIIVSTPKGLNHYATIWNDAESGKNDFVAIEAHWSENPGRDEKWLQGQLKELGQLKFNQEVLCLLVGSSNTLIDGPKLVNIKKMTPDQKFPHYDEFIPPMDGHSYAMTVDTSRGSDLDNSAFVVFDITQMPYKIVAKYAFNGISTLMFPEVIFKVGTRYHNAFVLIETNDLGQQVADILFYDLEYENVYMSEREAIKEGGGGDSRKRPGLRTTKRTKAIGCDQLKLLIESDHLEVNDQDIVAELMQFVRVGTSYKAEVGQKDDLAMCLVLFAYLTNSPVFKELFDFSLRTAFIKKQISEFEDQLDPIGFLDNGIDDPEPVVEFAGDLWTEVRPFTQW